MSVKQTKPINCNSSCGPALMSLKQKLMLNTKKKAFHSSKVNKKPSDGRKKGCTTALFSPKHYRGRKGIAKSPPACPENCNTLVSEHHHNYVSNQEFGKVSNNASSLALFEPSVEIELPFVDTTTIKSLITGYPQITFTGERNACSISCVRAWDGRRVTRKFETVVMLQSFLKSRNAKAWLMKESVGRSGKNQLSRNEICDRRSADLRDSSAKRLKQQVATSTVSPSTSGILKITFMEKCNAYRIDYISCNGQKVTKVFDKLSTLQQFLQSGDVRAVLMDMIEKCRTRPIIFSEGTSYSDVKLSEISSKCSFNHSVALNIKQETDDLDVTSFNSDLSNALPGGKRNAYLSAFQAFLQSDESESSLLDTSGKSFNDTKHCGGEEEMSGCFYDGEEKKVTQRGGVTEGTMPLANIPSSGEIRVKRHRGNKVGRYDIDTTPIKPLIAGYPKISYRKTYDFYRIVCIRACDGQRVATSFRNLSSLQTFLNSDDAKSWLMDELDTSARTYKGKPCPVSYNSDLLAIKPEICFLKPNRLRVLCIPKYGRPKTKFFRCSLKGHNDVEAMQKVNDFLIGQSFISWITSERRYDGTGNDMDSHWIVKDTIKTGPDMRLYLDDLLGFDCTKTVDMNPAVSPYLNIHHNPEVPSVSHNHNPGWGRAHRSDDTFTLKSNAPPNLFNRTYRVVSITMRCSSRSNMCRTTCGELLTSCRIVDGNFSCCNEPLPAHNECSHCRATTSSYDKWHKISDQNVLCRVCYNYLRKRKRPRPLKTKKAAPKAFYAHNQCQYKLRLELLSGLNHWRVFYHSSNKQEHDNATAVGCKRFTLTERDFIDRVRSSTGKPTAKQIGMNYRIVKRESSPHPLKQYQSRCKLIDTHILESSVETLEEGITINPDWRVSDGHDTFETEAVECIEFEINDTEPEFALNTTVPTLVETKPEKKSVKAEDSLIICFKCVMDPKRKDNPFSCGSAKDLDSHMKTSHKENLICCSICFQQGAIETFPSLRLLNHHIRKFHSKGKTYTIHYRTDAYKH